MVVYCSQYTIYGKRCRRLLTNKSNSGNNCWQHTMSGGFAKTEKEIHESRMQEKKEYKIKVPASPPRTLDVNKARTLEYRCTKKEIRLSIHLGQRKLLLSEIEFLTQYGHLSNLVVYAGAAHGLHIKYLSELFPRHYFELYDPATFLLKETRRIKIINDYFTDTIAESYRSKKVLFICDIRSAEFINESSSAFEREVKGNMEMQKKWVELIKPSKAILKFRLPYDATEMKYFKGDIYLQVWAPQTSTETRLITDGKKEMVYDTDKYNNQMFCFNRVTRVSWYPHSLNIDSVPGLDHCGDCKAEIEILRAYLKKHTVDHSDGAVARTMNKITQELGKPSSLDQAPHGLYPLIKDIEEKATLVSEEALKYMQKRNIKKERFSRNKSHSRKYRKSHSRKYSKSHSRKYSKSHSHCKSHSH